MQILLPEESVTESVRERGEPVLLRMGPQTMPIESNSLQAGSWYTAGKNVHQLSPNSIAIYIYYLSETES